MNRIILIIVCFLSFSFSSSAHIYSATWPTDTDFTLENNLKLAAFELHLQQTYSGAGLERAGLEFEVFKKAMIGYYNLKGNQLVSPSKSVLSVIDFTKSSKDKRLYIIDLKSKKVLYNTLVAHGKNTGDEFARKFSNAPNSYMSSAGFYVTNNTYVGKHGLSLRISGLDEGYNTNALARAVVIHGADYVSEKFIRQTGRLGRSLGCPALPLEQTKDIIQTIAGQTALYIHAPIKAYSSKFLNQGAALERFLRQA